MANAHENTGQTENDGVQPTDADAVVDPSMAPVEDDAGGPTADKGDAVDQHEQDEPAAEEAAAQLGDFA